MAHELLGGLVATVLAITGSLWWLKTHTHSDLVPRSELESLRQLMQAQHKAVLRELEQLRDLL